MQNHKPVVDSINKQNSHEKAIYVSAFDSSILHTKTCHTKLRRIKYHHWFAFIGSASVRFVMNLNESVK